MECPTFKERKSKSKTSFRKVEGWEVVLERGHIFYISDDHIRWEYLKYEIKCSIHFSVTEAKKSKAMNILEIKIKTFEENSNLRLKCKRDLDYIYGQILEGIKLRSKHSWYEDNKKSSNIFLNLETNRAIQNQIHLLTE